MSLLERVKEQKKGTSENKESSKENQVKPSKGYATGVDLLLGLIEESGSITFKKAASSLGVEINDIEEWGNILAKEGLAVIKYPALGSPLIKKKGQIEQKEKGKQIFLVPKPISEKKKVKKKIKTMVLIVLLIVLAGSFLLTWKGKQMSIAPGIQIITPKEEIVSIQDAFSGKGNYYCDFEKEDITAKYNIKDTTMRVETQYAGMKSIVLYFKGFLYTYLESENKWYKARPDPDALLPGSLKIPQSDVIINCYRSNEVNETLFALDITKVVI